jgi:hypothetical protein
MLTMKVKPQWRVTLVAVVAALAAWVIRRQVLVVVSMSRGNGFEAFVANPNSDPRILVKKYREEWNDPSLKKECFFKKLPKCAA